MMSTDTPKYRKIAVLFFETPLSGAESDELLTMARAFPDKIPEVLDIVAGMDENAVEGTLFGLSITLGSAEDFLRYRDHPVHKEFSQFTHSRGVAIRSAGYMS